MNSRILGQLAFCLALAAFASSAHAHTGQGVVGGFSSGFLHPVAGWDHVVAMIAVGLWGAFLDRPALWVLPIVFPLVMAFGGALGVAGVPVPYVEPGIAISAVVLGLAVALALRPPLWGAGLFVAFFAIFHGHAHGAELPEAANPFTYALGFVVATALLHILGIAFALLLKWPQGQFAVRGAGGVIALVGIAFLSGYA
jgi:urease accessory protein